MRTVLGSRVGVRLLLVALSAIIVFILADRVISGYRESRDRIAENYIQTTEAAVRAVIASYGDFSRYIIEQSIARDEVTRLIAAGIEDGDLERTRTELIERVSGLYADVTRFEFRQLHFHLPDGRSLLRMHAVEKWGDPLNDVRESVRVANAERRVVTGFEEGRIFNGYRFVFPLSYEGDHVGSVELSISFGTIAESLRREFSKTGELLLRRDVIEETVFADEIFHYQPTPITESYLVDIGTQPDSETLPLDRIRGEVAATLTDELGSAESFVVPVTVDRADYVASFVSIRNISGDHVAYFTTYEPGDEFRLLVAQSIGQGLLLTVALAAGLLVLGLANHARRLAVAASHAKSQFLANVSHELRTPMSGVLGMIDALDRPDLGPEQRTEYLRLLKSAGNDLLHIVNSILDMSRLDVGAVQLHEDAFSMRGLASDLVDQLRDAEIAEGLRIDLDVAAEVPQLVIGDPLRVRQILRNCLHNSLKFTHEGGVTIGIVEQSSGPAGSTILVTLTDTGIGIPAAQLPTLFEKFSQGKTSITQTYGGSGLGLSIVRGLVDLMGGSIDIRSVERVGTTVAVTLPFKAASETPIGDSSDIRSGSQTADTPTTGRFRVLLAEDDVVNRRMGQLLLEGRGIEVETATNGRIAVEKGAGGDYDAILMDLRMPEMDGMEATRMLLKTWIRDAVDPVPIIGLSGLVSEEDRQACMDAGMSGFVPKPIEIDAVLEAMNRSQSEQSDAEPIDLNRTQDTLSDPEELVREILPIFLEQTAERLDAIETGLRTRDARQIHAHTHPLKTAALYLGAGDLGEVARTIDDACRGQEEPQWAELEPLVSSLRHEVDRIEAWRAARVTP
ncbi:MAG TPA: ATP-binding protein [Spirochaetia bacterium]|nr:ATP-binding protein [Spirochaetia bacterium]